jgi:hypothetical protein
MRPSPTRYTIRSSRVSRRDQAPAAKYFNGSGFPIPVNGSRRVSSTIVRARKAIFRSVSTQYRKSSRNSGWKIASRCFFAFLPFRDFAKAHLSL